eukprot:830489-Amphidinium_carterae.1
MQASVSQKMCLCNAQTDTFLEPTLIPWHNGLVIRCGPLSVQYLLMFVLSTLSLMVKPLSYMLGAWLN